MSLNSVKLALVLLVLVPLGCGDSASPVSVVSALDHITASAAAVGAQGKVRVLFTSPVSADTAVMLVSSSPNVLTIPDHVTVPAGAGSVDVTYNAVTVGSSMITATHGDELEQSLAQVVQQFQVTSVTDVHLEVGATASSAIVLNAIVPDPVTITLTPSNPAVVNVPTSVTIPAFAPSVTFPVIGVAPGGTTLAAMLNGLTLFGNLTVVDHARLTSCDLPRAVEQGSLVTLFASLDADVAMPTAVTVSSDDPTLMVPTTLTVPAGANAALQSFVAATPGTTNVTCTLADSTAPAVLNVVTQAALAGVSTSATRVGFPSSVSVNLDASVAAPRDVQLTSSDPSVMVVPDHVTVYPQGSTGNVYVYPLSAGVTVISATLNGVTYQTTAIITEGDSPRLVMSGDFSMEVGAFLDANVQIVGGSGQVVPVTLTSSDPSIAAVPPSVNVTSLASIPVAGLSPGTTTIMASALGMTKSFDVTVVSMATIGQFGPTATVTTGTTGSSFLYLDAIPASGVQVTVSSSDPSVVTAPNPLTFSGSSTYVSVSYTGLMTGSVVLTATYGASTRGMVVYVVDPSTAPVHLVSGSSGIASKMVVGANGYGSFFLNGPAAVATPLPLTFSTPGVVATPAGMTPVIGAGQSQVTFPLTAVSAGSTTVTTTLGGFTASFSVTVVAAPTYTLNVPATIASGTSQTGTLSADALLPADVTFALASANAGLLGVSPATATLVTGSPNPIAQLILTGIAAGSTSVTATSGATIVTIPVMVTP